MAEGAKAKGKKIGRWSRKPTNSHYKAQNKRDANKKRRMDKQQRLFPKSKSFPGWEKREGYGWVRV
jgi:hypothetical protein